MSRTAICRNCDEPIRWSLDHRRWLHEDQRVRYCVVNFDERNCPTTEAEPRDEPSVAARRAAGKP